jgi:hypothetical protein
MKGWTSAALLAALVGSYAAPAGGGEALFRVAEMAVHDATGKRVGTLSAATAATSYPSATAATIALRTESGKLVLVTATGRELFGADTVYFTSADCSGRPWLSRPSIAPGLYGASALVGDGKSVYTQSGADREVVARSKWRVDGTCETGFSFSTTAAPATAAGVDLADYFTPPFSLRATRGAALAPGPAPERDDLEPTDALVVYDATGKKLGVTGVTTVFEPGSAVVAFVTGSGTIVAVEVTRNEIRQDESFYTSTDCTGRPFLDAPANGGLKPVTAVLPPRATVHVQAAAPRTRAMWSTRNGDGDCASFENGRHGAYVPAASTGLELADYFSAPFSVRAGRATKAVGSLN